MSTRWGNDLNSDKNYLLGGSKIIADGDYSHEMKLQQNKTFSPWKKSYDQPRQHIKK